MGKLAKGNNIFENYAGKTEIKKNEAGLLNDTGPILRKPQLGAA